MQHAHPASPRLPLDGTRIAANAGAIAINALLFGGLVLLSQPALDWRLPEPELEIVDIVLPERITPPPPPPEVVPVRPPQPRPVVEPRPQPVPREVAPEPSADVVEPMPGDIAVDPPIGEPGEAVASIDTTTPVTGVQLTYRVATPPPYPAAALRAGITGVVTLRVEVDPTGTPVDVRIERSSGDRTLDASARRHVLARWRFEPARRGGVAVPAIALVPIEFTLDR